jgi:hypothetical protein
MSGRVAEELPEFAGWGKSSVRHRITDLARPSPLGPALLKPVGVERESGPTGSTVYGLAGEP